MFISVLHYLYFFFIFIFLIFIQKRNRNIDKCPSNYNLLASGSSSNHFHLLLLMIHRIFSIESSICFVAWDLGLSRNEKVVLLRALKYIENNRNDIHTYYRLFNYSNYPAFYNITNMNYAWKVFVIHNTYVTFKRNMLWLDSGCFIKDKLVYEFKQIQKRKIWSIKQNTKIGRYTHHFMLKLLETEKKFYNKYMCAGGIIGLYYPSSLVFYILEQWKACSLIKNCISPNGSNLSNHRYDQSVISILLYEHNLGCENLYPRNFVTHFDTKYSMYNDSHYNIFLKRINYVY